MPWGFYFGFNFLVNLFCDLRKYPPSAFVRKMALDSYLHFIPSGFNPFYQFFFFFFYSLRKERRPIYVKGIDGPRTIRGHEMGAYGIPPFPQITNRIHNGNTELID